MLNLDPHRRLSLDAVLSGPWVSGGRAGAKPTTGLAGGMPAGRGGAGTAPIAHADAGGDGPHYRSLGPASALAQLSAEQVAAMTGGSGGSSGGGYSAGGADGDLPLGGIGGGFGGAHQQMVDDDEPVYRSMGSLVPPPALVRQRAFDTYSATEEM